MEKYEIIKQATSTGEPPEYTWTVMPDGKIFDTKQEAKDYITRDPDGIGRPAIIKQVGKEKLLLSNILLR